VTTSTYLWRRIDTVGLVLVRLVEAADGVSAEGSEICVEGDDRWAARFTVALDSQWRHERTTVEVLDATGARRLELESDGCTDIDLAGNPFTNAFVTRRVAPPIGAEIEIRAAYVEAPALSVRPLVQRYERVAADRWVYADDSGRFELTTDADGVAVDYENLAQRL
jgi:hypothetical protein